MRPRSERLAALRLVGERLRTAGPRRRRLGRGRPAPSLDALELLDRGLARAGVHTVADLRLLVRAARAGGRLASVADAFGARVDGALDALEARLRWASATDDGRWPAGERGVLDRAFERAERLVRTADVLAHPGSAADDAPELPPRPPSPPGPSTAGRAPAGWSRPRTVLAARLLDGALGEVADPERRRRDVERAHRLLETGALDEDATALRLAAARDRTWADEAPPAAGWTAQARWLERTAQRDPARAWAALRVQWMRAVESGRTGEARALRAALEAFRTSAPGERGASGRSATGSTPGMDRARGRDVRAETGAPRGEGAVAELVAAPGPEPLAPDDALAALLLGAEPPERRTLARGLAAARAVVWDDAPDAATVRTDEPTRAIAPDRTIALAWTGQPGDAADFVLEDPRRLLRDLAAGAQRVRRLEGGTAPVRARPGRARLLLADASGSMRGPRARFRDALLVAELDGLRRTALAGRPVEPIELCFFGDRTLRFERIADAASARDALARLAGGAPCAGMTELTSALVSAARHLGAEGRRRPELARALVVVVTDGEDAVDVDVIEEAWAGPLARDAALRVVCLGDENRWLKAWVARRRAAGADAGWWHLDDAGLLGDAGDFDFRPPTLLPGPESVEGVDLARLAPHLEALSALASGEAPPRVPVDVLRFDAFFPEPAAPERLDGADATGAGPQAPDDDAWTVDALEALAEAAALAPFEERAAEAVGLLEHLLEQRAVPVALHLRRHARPGPRTAAALRRIRLLCRPA